MLNTQAIVLENIEEIVTTTKLDQKHSNIEQIYLD